MDKTVTVRADFSRFLRRAGIQVKRGKKILAHDELEECVAGDKVIIAYTGSKISNNKSHYVRSIEVPFPRMPIEKPSYLIE